MKIKKKFYFILLIILILAIGVFLFWKIGGRSFEIIGSRESKSLNKGQPNPITGLECENYNQRPIAVMLATDPVTRPLSGISSADLVVEMAVITDSITRLMAVYICEEPEEIGSVRSARHDFIPLAMGLDAIFAHWGGSHFALDKLDAGIMDNIDAMKNPFNAYWQNWTKPMPHNGFTSFSRLINAAEKLGYRLENNFEGYPHLKNTKYKLPNTSGKLTIGFGNKYRVYYEYNPKTNTYLRWRGGEKEIDKNNNKQVETSVIAVMRAASRMIQPPDYNDVDVEGEGEAIIYQNGEEIRGIWKKQGGYTKSKLYFLDYKGKEIKFTPGRIWIEIAEPYQEVKWEI
jgi:hypothetical protein